jgi:hypothetical protein
MDKVMQCWRGGGDKEREGWVLEEKRSPVELYQLQASIYYDDDRQ